MSHCSEAKNTTRGVILSTVNIFAISSPNKDSVILVAAFGAMTFAFMLYFAPSIARTLVSPTIPIFAAP